MGKAEGQGKVQKGYRCLKEIDWSQADESSFEEEIISNDEGKVGGEEGQDIGQDHLCSALPSLRRRVGVMRGVGKSRPRWGNLGCAGVGWQTVGSAPEENRFTVSRRARRVYYGAVSEIEKEIPAKAVSRSLGVKSRSQFPRSFASGCSPRH